MTHRYAATSFPGRWPGQCVEIEPGRRPHVAASGIQLELAGQEIVEVPGFNIKSSWRESCGGAAPRGMICARCHCAETIQRW